MSLSAVLLSPPSHRHGDRAGEGLDLTAVLELIEGDPGTPCRPANGAAGGPSALLERVQEWSRRAAEWGAGPDGAWRAW